MVGNASANPHRLKRFVRTQFPDDGYVHPWSVLLTTVGAATLRTFRLRAPLFGGSPGVARSLITGRLRSCGLP
jgi:hypothetical protein